MDKDAVIAVLRAHEAELRSIGIVHAALFGSIARGDDGPHSDIDIAIDLEDGRPLTIYDYAGMRRRVAELFDRDVDVVDRTALRPGIRESAAADLVYAF